LLVSCATRPTARRFEFVCEAATALAHGLDTYTDIKLRADLDAFLGLADRDRTALHEWLAVGPTETRELQHSLGLFRDCTLYDPDLRLRGDGRVKRLNEGQLREPVLRAHYLSANAYLELSSVDILSDLIRRVASGNDPALRRLISDLNRQLLDEARHAELLAGRVEALGYELGCAPVCLHTWRVYESFESVAERLVVQQVLQEITADEKTHVDLGLRWVSALSAQPITELMAAVAVRAEEIEPMPKVPVSLELRRQCRYPEEWLAKEVAEKGVLPINDIRTAVIESAARARGGRVAAEPGS
jgi:hypothetical protein